MKKVFLSFLLCLSLIILSSTNVNFALASEISNISDVVEIVETATYAGYGIDCENITVKPFNFDDGKQKYYCYFQSELTNGYAVVNSIDDELYIEKIWLENTEYYDDEYLNGGSSFDEHLLTVSYTNRTQDNYKLALTYPAYDLSVTCVPKAATNIFGFYDKYFTDLIPNFEPGYMYYGYYRYYEAAGAYGNEVATQLATDMGAVDQYDGVTVNEFKAGFQTYCSRKGLSASYSSCMSYGSFNFNTAKAQIDSGKPLIVFLSAYNMTTLSSSNNVDTLDMQTSTVPHAMAVFGYRSVTYTLSNGQTRVDNYLHTATGAPNPSTSLLNLSYYVDIDDAYSVSIS